jgi:HK97 family phage portal protein
MSLLSRLGAMVRGAALPQPRPGNAISQALMFLRSGPIDMAPFPRKEDQLGAYVGWAYAAVNRIGMDVLSAPRKLWKKTGAKKDDWIEIQDEDQPALFRKPTAYLGMGEFLQTTLMHLDLTGEAYWHLVTAREAGGKVLGIQPIYPHWVEEPILDERGILTGWRVTIPGRSYYVVPAEDMVFIKYPHPMDPLRGMSPVEAYAITHDMDLYTRAYASTLMKNRATPELVVTTDQPLTPEQATVLRESWMDKYRDPRSGPAILGNGTKVQQLGLSIADLKFLELTQASRETILAIYGVPAAIIGMTTDFNRANSETAKAIYFERVIAPRLALLEETFNNQVLPRMMMTRRGDVETFWWGFDAEAPEDRDFALRQADLMFKAGAFSLNEYREKLGVDPLGKDGDVYYMPMGVSVVSSVSLVTDEEPEPLPEIPADPAATQLPPPDAKPDDAAKPEDKPADQPEPPTEKFMGTAIAIRAGEDKTLRMRAAKAEFLERQGRLERNMKSEVRKLFSREQALLIARLKQEGARANFRKETRARLMLDASGQIARDWADDELEDLTEDWESTFREFMLRGMREGWLLVAADVGQSINWNLYRAEAEKYARELAGRKIVAIQDTTRKGVRKIIGDGIAEGKSIDDMADDLRRLYDGFKGYRAEVISRSETAASVNVGKSEFADAAEERLDLKLMKTWVAVQDDRTRDSHVAADGQTIPQSEQFQIGNAFLDQPGDPMGPPEETIACRCTCTYSAAE